MRFARYAALALTVPGVAPAVPTADPGQRLYVQCQACHSLKRGEPHKVGPNLHGVIGAAAASRAGYTYSPALKKSGVRWDDVTLDRWLQRSSAVVPGNKMIFAGMSNPDQRRALITYLKRVTR